MGNTPRLREPVRAVRAPSAALAHGRPIAPQTGSPAASASPAGPSAVDNGPEVAAIVAVGVLALPLVGLLALLRRRRRGAQVPAVRPRATAGDGR
ncbi:MAG TPA: hypothetical protein VEL73_02390 [Mycobacteriales bacterium]|nr:hypothetical protein [Mycobacteriales bacterium]